MSGSVRILSVVAPSVSLTAPSKRTRRVVDALRSGAADVVCVHGAPRAFRRRARRAALARRTGLVIVSNTSGSGAELILSSLAVDEILDSQPDLDLRSRLETHCAYTTVRVRGLDLSVMAGQRTDRPGSEGLAVLVGPLHTSAVRSEPDRPDRTGVGRGVGRGDAVPTQERRPFAWIPDSRFGVVPGFSAQVIPTAAGQLLVLAPRGADVPR